MTNKNQQTSQLVEAQTNLKSNNLKSKLILWAVCFLVAFVLITIGSSNSFIYPFSDNNDVSWFITMGNGLLAGKVPYKHLFEQKGPLLYLVFGFLCLFNNPYVATYVLEVITFAVFLYFSYKICQRIIKNTFVNYVCVIAIGALVISSPFFYNHGGAVEEFFLPAFSYLLLCLMEFIEDGKQFTITRALTIGAILSAMFWVKFTILLLPALMLIVWLVYCIKNKQTKQMFVLIGYMFASFVALSVLINIYYVAKHAFKDMLKVYVKDNLFGYTKVEYNTTGVKRNFVAQTLLCIVNAAFMAVGAIFYIKQHKKQAIWLPVVICTGVILQIIIKLYIYYFLVFEIFAVLGMAYTFKPLERANFKTASCVGVCALVCLCSLCGVVFLGNKTGDILRKPNYYPQVEFAKIINNSDIKNPTLFCYNMYDYGFYNAAHIVPQEYYFARNNFSYEGLPQMYDSFDIAIKEKHADFVIVMKEDYDKNLTLFNGRYQEVSTQTYVRRKTNFEKQKLTFMLLKRV